MAAGYVFLTLTCLLFALGALTPLLPVEQRSASADSQDNAYSGEYRAFDDEYIGHTEIVFSVGGSYQGGFEGHRFNGQGEFFGPEGWVLTGSFTDGHLEGQGTYIGQGITYTGEFHNSLPEGQGTLVSGEGWKYEGGFAMGKVNGEGVFTSADGSVYSGSFTDGYADGSGQITSAAWSYVGDLTMGFRNGSGTLTYDTGETHEAIWQAGYPMMP
jgi:hypothetical protein